MIDTSRNTTLLSIKNFVRKNRTKQIPVTGSHCQKLICHSCLYRLSHFTAQRSRSFHKENRKMNNYVSKSLHRIMAVMFLHHFPAHCLRSAHSQKLENEQLPANYDSKNRFANQVFSSFSVFLPNIRNTSANGKLENKSNKYN